MEVNFLELPSVIWVKIMKYLTLGERYNASLTCWCLYDYFNHPSLWSDAKIVLIGGSTNFNTYNSLISNKCVKLVETFGKFFQNLYLKLNGHLGLFDKKTKFLLEVIADNCRLRSLTLEIGVMTSSFHLDGKKPGYQEVMIILSLIRKAVRLKELNIISWPMYPLLQKGDYSLFEVLRQNKKLKDLEHLSLFWSDGQNWSEREPILPSPLLTTQTVANFQKLKRVSLRTPMLSDALLEELSQPGRGKLQILQIYVTYSLNKDCYDFPDISIETWKKLKFVHPQLEVECTVVTRVACNALDRFLKPEIPLCKLTILKHGKCTNDIMQILVEYYFNTLQSLVLLCGGGNMDDHIMKLLKKSPNLNTLVISGGLKNVTNISIKDMKEKKWKHLHLHTCYGT